MKTLRILLLSIIMLSTLVVAYTLFGEIQINGVGFRNYNKDKIIKELSSINSVRDKVFTDNTLNTKFVTYTYI